ncbi:sensor histidine kinase [Priestia abyssalis]|uniref:sensor histidine kinase n=1 Tax=Priestia abyssalis TaxID=1221450 RepID=UPI000994B764|nr:HAMP domain-containing sensor histidine kinase [Priestia abyssalis]
MVNFTYINQNVLDNLFYILASLFLYFVLYENVKRLKRYKKTLMTICMSLPMILSMRFPIYIDEYCVHDLRQIPFIIGTLYGGWPVGAALLTILLTVRFVFYGANFLTVIVYIVIFIATALYSTRFNTLNRKRKVTASVLLSFVLAVVTTFIAVMMSDSFRVTEAYVFYFIVLPPVIMFFAVSIIELLSDALFIRSKVVKLEKMEVVSQLAASISHEVRNPLTVVKGFIELLKDPGLSQEVRDQYIQHVARELKSAESIISDYLAFAKPAAEKVEHISIDRELRNIMEVIKPLANMNSVTISDKLVPGMVLGNTKYFQQCFLNLIKNGIEAMPDGGELSVISAVNKTHMTIEISDTGVGMTKEQINRFGEPYYSSKEKGTGLGSMVAVRIIQTMKGTFDIKSTLNEGTTITISFPVCMDEQGVSKL